jgi:hypothetical protein
MKSLYLAVEKYFPFKLINLPLFTGIFYFFSTQGLLALKKCIEALNLRALYTPYQDSKLTMLLSSGKRREARWDERGRERGGRERGKEDREEIDRYGESALYMR